MIQISVVSTKLRVLDNPKLFSAGLSWINSGYTTQLVKSLY
jgi:hypothetical protein